MWTEPQGPEQLTVTGLALPLGNYPVVADVPFTTSSKRGNEVFGILCRGDRRPF